MGEFTRFNPKEDEKKIKMYLRLKQGNTHPAFANHFVFFNYCCQCLCCRKNCCLGIRKFLKFVKKCTQRILLQNREASKIKTEQIRCCYCGEIFDRTDWVCYGPDCDNLLHLNKPDSLSPHLFHVPCMDFLFLNNQEVR
jgi:hypothetical protein